MYPFLVGDFGNPSSQHEEGRRAFQAIEKARVQIASLIGAESGSNIYFFPSATVANNVALSLSKNIS